MWKTGKCFLFVCGLILLPFILVSQVNFESQVQQGFSIRICTDTAFTMVSQSVTIQAKC